MMETGKGDRVSEGNLREGRGYVEWDLLVLNNRTWKCLQLTVTSALLLYMKKLRKSQSFTNLSSAEHPAEWQEHRYKLLSGSIADYILFFWPRLFTIKENQGKISRFWILGEETPFFPHWRDVSFSQMPACYLLGHFGVSKWPFRCYMLLVELVGN